MNTGNPWDKIHTNIGDLLWVMTEDDIESLEIQQGRGFQESKPLLRVLPKPPSSCRHYFKRVQRSTFAASGFQQIMLEAEKLLQRAFMNNDYLLGLRDITIEQQAKDLNKLGVIYSVKSIKSYKEGKHKSINLVLPTALAVYHGEPLLRFLTQDYPAQKLSPFKAIAPRDHRLIHDRLPSELRRTYGIAETPIK
jgi:hypothetical protein